MGSPDTSRFWALYLQHNLSGQNQSHPLCCHLCSSQALSQLPCFSSLSSPTAIWLSPRMAAQSPEARRARTLEEVLTLPAPQPDYPTQPLCLVLSSLRIWAPAGSLDL
jgi:hypothetical protein